MSKPCHRSRPPDGFRALAARFNHEGLPGVVDALSDCPKIPRPPPAGPYRGASRRAAREDM
ncbi:hypothetical protein SAMN05192584_12013 [Streptomyces pini]|uniref:Uncharacterized protein n=1 Tax=Streptomyces pini TaxID=1520580 RepID=A0A1I4I6I2_9ACTN|nr:hypothetical protein SAMN05192584_12013 [Streptomyces pini]